MFVPDLILAKSQIWFSSFQILRLINFYYLSNIHYFSKTNKMASDSEKLSFYLNSHRVEYRKYLKLLTTLGLKGGLILR